jgi:hypothetical protein
VHRDATRLLGDEARTGTILRALADQLARQLDQPDEEVDLTEARLLAYVLAEEVEGLVG